jgi:hypothetical protein
VQLSPQSERAAKPGGPAALSFDTDPTSDSREDHPSAEDARLASLRQQFAPFGLSVYRLIGSELALTGAGLSRSLPDDRCAWMLLRQLKGGTA